MRPSTFLGTNLTEATSFNFNGKLATFSVVSSSEIRSTVPAGATTLLANQTGTLLGKTGMLLGARAWSIRGTLLYLGADKDVPEATRIVTAGKACVHFEMHANGQTWPWFQAAMRPLKKCANKEITVAYPACAKAA